MAGTFPLRDLASKLNVVYKTHTSFITHFLMIKKQCFPFREKLGKKLGLVRKRHVINIFLHWGWGKCSGRCYKNPIL